MLGPNPQELMELEKGLAEAREKLLRLAGQFSKYPEWNKHIGDASICLRKFGQELTGFKIVLEEQRYFMEGQLS